MAKIELVIFDCDGVLIDSEIISTRVQLEHFKPYGFEVSEEEYSKRFAGLVGSQIKSIIEEEVGRSLPDDIYEKIDIDTDIALVKDVKALPGINWLLDNFDQPRCICSNSSGSRLEKTLKKAELHNRFKPYIFAAAEVGDKTSKPSPNVFLHAAKTFDVKPENCVVIEDSGHGLEGAKAAGMRTIGYVGGSHTYQGHSEALMDAGAETVVRSLREVKEVIAAYEIWDGDLEAI